MIDDKQLAKVYHASSIYLFTFNCQRNCSLKYLIPTTQQQYNQHFLSIKRKTGRQEKRKENGKIIWLYYFDLQKHYRLSKQPNIIRDFTNFIINMKLDCVCNRIIIEKHYCAQAAIIRNLKSDNRDRTEALHLKKKEKLFWKISKPIIKFFFFFSVFYKQARHFKERYNFIERTVRVSEKKAHIAYYTCKKKGKQSIKPT
ncbi:hypothetical protein EDC96DRAFT_540231 [Choanephora cucurbitarum]|nr:hypothetical protein EDC96DRAFT_540231 [Choanephora cucurbitarum]